MYKLGGIVGTAAAAAAQKGQHELEVRSRCAIICIQTSPSVRFLLDDFPPAVMDVNKHVAYIYIYRTHVAAVRLYVMFVVVATVGALSYSRRRTTYIDGFYIRRRAEKMHCATLRHDFTTERRSPTHYRYRQ